jgi:hypothetical protein
MDAETKIQSTTDPPTACRFYFPEFAVPSSPRY